MSTERITAAKELLKTMLESLDALDKSYHALGKPAPEKHLSQRQYLMLGLAHLERNDYSSYVAVMSELRTTHLK